MIQRQGVLYSMTDEVPLEFAPGWYLENYNIQEHGKAGETFTMVRGRGRDAKLVTLACTGPVRWATYVSGIERPWPVPT